MIMMSVVTFENRIVMVVIRYDSLKRYATLKVPRRASVRPEGRSPRSWML